MWILSVSGLSCPACVVVTPDLGSALHYPSVYLFESFSKSIRRSDAAKGIVWYKRYELYKSILRVIPRLGRQATSAVIQMNSCNDYSVFI
jgi:hypothetical protein